MGRSHTAAAQDAVTCDGHAGGVVARVWRYVYPVHEAPSSKSYCKSKIGIPRTWQSETARLLKCCLKLRAGWFAALSSL